MIMCVSAGKSVGEPLGVWSGVHEEHQKTRGLEGAVLAGVMPARHEDTQDHGKQHLFHNLSYFPAWAPLGLDISGPSLFIQQTARFFIKRQRRANPHVLPSLHQDSQLFLEY